jgi:hypothetical protein
MYISKTTIVEFFLGHPNRGSQMPGLNLAHSISESQTAIPSHTLEGVVPKVSHSIRIRRKMKRKTKKKKRM